MSETKTFSADTIRQICLDAGADDCGFVDIDRETIADQREGLLSVYNQTRSIITFVKQMNRENIQSPARYVANEEIHYVGEEVTHIPRMIIRELNKMGIRGVAANKSFPMDMNKWPGKIWDVSHKLLGQEAGLGLMGVNRMLIHHTLGSAVFLNSILINADLDEYDKPVIDDPCDKCNLCTVVCPTGALTKDEPFDFGACITHTYRDNNVGFQRWVETIIKSNTVEDYKEHYRESDTSFMWQSLMYKLNYRCGYCQAICPAGDAIRPDYLKDKKAFVNQVIKPLKDKAEPVFVLPGSPAEEKAKRHPNKEVRVIRN